LQLEAPQACRKVQQWVDIGTERNEDGQEVPIETVCPVLFINQYGIVFRAFNYSEQGILPFAGGWTEQPAKLMHFVGIVRRIAHEKG